MNAENVHYHNVINVFSQDESYTRTYINVVKSSAMLL